MKKMTLLLIFSILFVACTTTMTYASDYDEYIIKYINTNSIKVITEQEKSQYEHSTKLKKVSPHSSVELIEPNYDVTLFDNHINWNAEMVKSDVPWDYGCFGNGVKIAIIDSGISQHPYLQKNLLLGYNFIDNTTDTTDNIGHGTFVSGIIGATLNDDFTEGIAKEACLIPLKCFESGYITKVDKIIKAIYYAVDDCNCKVINMSFGLSNDSECLKSAIDYALSKNVIIVAAVGNYGTTKLQYPAAYEGVIGVGAVNKEQICSLFSQHNSSVDVVAPGEDISGILINKDLDVSGTSFSAPHVTAAAAIAICIDEKITQYEFNDLIKETAIDLGENGYDTYYGYGLLNIGKMSKQLIENTSVFLSPITINNQVASTIVTNNSDEHLSATGIFTSYHDKKYITSKFTNIELDAHQKMLIKCTPEQFNVKCFVWENLNRLKPLCDSRISK